MLALYPPGQIIPGQHPRYPNHWKAGSISQVLTALETAPHTLEKHDIFMLHMYEEIHVDLTRDHIVLQELEELAAKYKVWISNFGTGTWEQWNHQLHRSIIAIKITKVSSST